MSQETNRLSRSFSSIDLQAFRIHHNAARAIAILHNRTVRKQTGDLSRETHLHVEVRACLISERETDRNRDGKRNLKKEKRQTNWQPQSLRCLYHTTGHHRVLVGTRNRPGFRFASTEHGKGRNQGHHRSCGFLSTLHEKKFAPKSCNIPENHRCYVSSRVNVQTRTLLFAAQDLSRRASRKKWAKGFFFVRTAQLEGRKGGTLKSTLRVYNKMMPVGSSVSSEKKKY